jgi:hypothetical protein
MVLEMSVFIEGSDADGSLQILGLASDNSMIELDGVGKVAM